MPRLPLLTLALAALLAACGGGSAPQLGPLADQADRVAQLIEDGQGCEAADALADLRRQAEQDAPTDVRDAVVGFATSAQQSVTCDPTPTEAPPTTEPPAEPEPDEGQGDEGRDDEDDDDDKPGRGRGRGGDDDEGDDEDSDD